MDTLVMDVIQAELDRETTTLIERLAVGDEVFPELEHLVSAGGRAKADNHCLHEWVRSYIEAAGQECDLNWIDTSAVTDMCYLFYGCKEFNGDVSKWDVSHVADMSLMFDMCGKFNGDLSVWDVSGATDMSAMFQGCKEFNRDLSGWDISNVEDMAYMFNGCKEFNWDLSRWDVSGVANNYRVFIDCAIAEERRPAFPGILSYYT